MGVLLPFCAKQDLPFLGRKLLPSLCRMAEVSLPSAGRGEFAKLQDSLSAVGRLLDEAARGLRPELVAEAGDAVRAHTEARALLSELLPRCDIFERRARETDPDKVIYGPKMVKRVLDLCEGARSSAEHLGERAPSHRSSTRFTIFGP